MSPEGTAVVVVVVFSGSVVFTVSMMVVEHDDSATTHAAAVAMRVNDFNEGLRWVVCNYTVTNMRELANGSTSTSAPSMVTVISPVLFAF